MPPPQASADMRSCRPKRLPALRRCTLLALSLLMSMLAAGCGLAAPPTEVPQTTIFPKSDAAHIINNLYILIFVLATIVFIVIQAAIVYILWRFRYREGHPLPEQTHGNTKLEIGWTIGPAVVLLAIAVPTIQGVFALEGSAPAVDGSGRQVEGALPIEVIGRQWWWEYRYPEQGIVTANELVIPVGRTVELQMTSRDVVHSYWIPQLMGKQDVMPAHVNTLWFTAQEAGQYWGQCGEYCGIEHAMMRMNAIAYEQADWDAWVARNAQPSPAAAQQTNELAEQGAQLFTQRCLTCHAIAGTAAQARNGPDLSHVGSRTTIAAGILRNDTEGMARWLRDPDEVKPGNYMAHPPAEWGVTTRDHLLLRPQDVDALVEYLHSLK